MSFFSSMYLENVQKDIQLHSMTQYGKYQFGIKKGADSTPFIAMSDPIQELDIFANGFLTFEFEEGTPIREIEFLEYMLNNKVKLVGYTGSAVDEWSNENL